jgi:hypothetical protein
MRRTHTDKMEAEGMSTSFVECQEPARTSTIRQVDDSCDTYALCEPGQVTTVS